MFYHVAKGTKDKEKYEERRSTCNKSNSRTSHSTEMEPGLFSRNYHTRSRSKSPRPSSGAYSRSRSRNRTDDDCNFLDDGDDSARPFPDDPNDDDAVFGHDGNEEEKEFISVPKGMLGQPLKDFDNPQEKPDTPEKTFLVVGNKFGKQVVFRFSKEKSLFLLSTENYIRRTNIYIFTHQLFEIGILLTIVTNCIFMAMSGETEVALISEYVFAAIYTFEMIVKILAKGFILHPYSYLRNAWNWLDFCVVVLGYVTMHPSVNELSGIRTFRVLRALKTISTVKGLKAMVNTLLKSMKMMTDVMILTVFFIAIFSLIGLQLFKGALHNRCIEENVTGIYFSEEHHQRKHIQRLRDDESAKPHIEMFNGEQVICGNHSTAWNCKKGYVCLADMGKNPIEKEGSYISYDAFHNAFLTTFQVVTLDYWETVFNNVISACGEIVVLYYLMVVFLGPFYLLNLVLAIVSASYETEINGNDTEEEENRISLQRTASNYSFGGLKYVEYLHGETPVVIEDGRIIRYVDAEPSMEEMVAENKIDYYSTEPESQPRKFFYGIANSKPFDVAIIFCIMANTVIMGSEHFNMGELQQKIGEIANYVFTAAFVMEMIVKLFAYTPRGYITNAWNCFDGTLVLFSIVDIMVTQTADADSGSPLKILKVFRLLRVLKLAQSWQVMGNLLRTIASSLGALGNVTVILGLIIYIFSVVGMQLFGKKYDPNMYVADNEQPDDFGKLEQYPRFNFYNFGESFIMIFRILCGKWIEPQWQLLKRGSYASIIFILAVFVVGRWVVLNLFLALLLSSFGGDALNSGESPDDDRPDLEPIKENKTRIQQLVEWTKKRKRKKKKKKEKLNNSETEVSIQINGANIITDDPPEVVCEKSEPPLINGVTSNGDTMGNLSNSTEDTMSEIMEQGILNQEKEKKFVDDCMCKLCYDGDCCLTSYLHSPLRKLWHNARYQTNRFIDNKYFEGTILFLIGFSSITLVFEDIYLQDKPNLEMFLGFCNYFFAIIFTLEFLIKLFAFGFVKYFTNFWNLLDVAIVAISLITLLGKSKNLNALRSLRGLRPLRAISRFEGMKVVVNALVYSVPSIANVLLVCGVFWLIFSIMGYNLFNGQFYRCVDKDGVKVHHSIINNKTECDNAKDQGYEWVNARVHFDDAFNGMLPLFQTATLEGWFEAMADAHDVRGVGLQPGYRENYMNQMFFVLFILLGSFFILNLFIGVIIDNFNRLKQQYEDGAHIFLTSEQRNWINTLKVAALKKPCRITKRPKSKWRGTLFDFTSSKYFEFFIMSVIVLNMTTMMIQHHNQTKEFTQALNYLNFVFTGIFTIEAVVRLIAMELEYFKSHMNVFDFVIVLFSIAVIIMDAFDKPFPISPGLFRVIRVLRLGRLLRFIDSAKGIRKLLFTIIKSAPALRNIGTLLFLITFIFAIIGMNLFKTLRYGSFLTPATNFETFLSSFCLLFRISTAAGWNGVLDSARDQKDIAVNDTVIVIYFVMYIMLINLIIINMYIAVILENFNQATSQEDIGISEDDLDAYYNQWQNVDPNATQFIKYEKLSDFIDSLEDPLRVGKPNYWFLEQADIPIKERDVCHCLDIMKALIKRSVYGNVAESIVGDNGAGGGDEDLASVLIKVEEKYDLVFPQRKKEPEKTTTKKLLLAQNLAARKIQAVFRKHLLLERIDLMSKNSRNVNQKLREKNVVTVEHLVTKLWKRNDEESINPEDPDFDGGSETDEVVNPKVL